MLNHSQSDGFSHLYNTFKILKNNGLDEDICLAGLFHCIYGTGSYNDAEELKIDRDVVRDLIGEQAENLVMEYKKCFPRNISLFKFGKIEENLRRKLLWISYANAIEQSYRMPKYQDGILLHRNAIDEIDGI